jgi:phosphatidylglycerophosphatase A
MATILITIIAIREINKYEEKSGIHDDKRIVIDELAGMWFALSVAPAMSISMGDMTNFENGFLVQAVLSFVFFRYFDIAKPSIIGRIDREAKGGIGVMGDDVIAGFAAGISSSLIWQGWLQLQGML